VNAAAVAGLDQELDVCVHEWNSHGDGATVGKNEVRVVAEALDDGEDVVPTTAVEARGVIAEFVDDLGRGQCL
jgi:bisphosphoglycerate-independent phosphoglycerate mutase (AlkP superfamily)